MAEGKHTPPRLSVVRPLPERIPRYVRNLNALGERAGFRVTVSVEPDETEGSPDFRLWSTWQGTKEQLLALGLLKPHQARALIPLTEGSRYVSVGGSCNWYWERSLLRGSVTVDGDAVCWKIDSGPSSYAIADSGPVEVVRYADWIAYHGTADQLAAAGIVRERLPMKLRPYKSESWWPDKRTAEWHSRRHPDGQILYLVASEAATRRKLEEIERSGGLELPNPPVTAAAWEAMTVGHRDGLLEALRAGLAPGRRRFSLAEADAARVQGLIDQFRDSFAAALGSARVVDAQARQGLRVVVDNTRLH